MAAPGKTQESASPQLEEALAGLGLTSTERRAYQFLLEHGASTPTQVAAATRQSRGRIYETLRLLVERGLAREEPSRPIRYLAATPAEAVRVALLQAERQGALLRRAYGTLARSSTTSPAPGPRAKPTDVAVLQGRTDVHDELRRLADAARQVVHLEGNPRFFERVLADAALVKSLQAASRRGVRVVAHHPAALPAPVRSRLEKALGGHGLNPLSPATTPSSIGYLATESAALQVHAQPDDGHPSTGQDVAFRGSNAAFAADVIQRYDNVAASAAETPVATDRPTDLPKAFARSVDEARTEIVAFDAVLGPPLVPEPDAFAERWRRARGRGVALRLLLMPESAKALRDRGRPWEARVVPWVPAKVALVDGRDLHQVVDGADGPEGSILRTTRDPREIRFYLDLFERLWAQAKPLG